MPGFDPHGTKYIKGEMKKDLMRLVKEGDAETGKSFSSSVL